MALASAAASSGHALAKSVEFDFLFGVEAVVEGDQLGIFRLHGVQPVFKKGLMKSEPPLKGGHVRLFGAKPRGCGFDGFFARLLKRLVRRRLGVAQTQMCGQLVRLLAAAFVILATSLPADYPVDEIFAMYRLRWQIELAFKRLKSLLNIDRLPATSDKGARSWIYAHLIVALLTDAESQDFLESSP